MCLVATSPRQEVVLAPPPPTHTMMSTIKSVNTTSAAAKTHQLRSQSGKLLLLRR